MKEGEPTNQSKLHVGDKDFEDLESMTWKRGKDGWLTDFMNIESERAQTKKGT